MIHCHDPWQFAAFVPLQILRFLALIFGDAIKNQVRIKPLCVPACCRESRIWAASTLERFLRHWPVPVLLRERPEPPTLRNDPGQQVGAESYTWHHGLGAPGPRGATSSPGERRAPAEPTPLSSKDCNRSALNRGIFLHG